MDVDWKPNVRLDGVTGDGNGGRPVGFHKHSTEKQMFLLIKAPSPSQIQSLKSFSALGGAAPPALAQTRLPWEPTPWRRTLRAVMLLWGSASLKQEKPLQRQVPYTFPF